MSSIILPSRFYSQPQGAVEVDWSNPLTRGLVSAIYYGAPMGESDIDPVSGLAVPWSDDTNITRNISSRGRTVKFWTGLTTSRLTTQNALPFTKDGSIVALVNPSSLASVNHNVVAAKGDQNFYLSFYDKKPYCKFTTTNHFGTTTATVGKWYTLGSSLFGGVGRLYLDGRLEESAADTASITPAAVFKYGNYSNNTLPFYGDMAFVAVFNRGLTGLEHRLLAENPWQLFKARPRILYFDVGGGVTIEGNPIAFQWDKTSATVNETINTIPVNWEWSTTTGNLIERLDVSPIGFQWEVTTGTIQEGATTVIDSTPISWIWEQNQASFINRLESNVQTFAWEISTGALTENLNTQSIDFQWETTTGTLVGTTTYESVPVSWEWEITSGNIIVKSLAAGPETIGGKKDKTRKARKTKLPYYESKDYESRIVLEDIPEEKPIIEVKKPEKVSVPTKIVAKDDKEVKLISNLVSELKPVLKQEIKVVEQVVEVSEGFDEETAVIMLLFAA